MILRILGALLLALVWWLRPGGGPPGGAGAANGDGIPADACVVAYVTDGDTVRCADGRRVRLLLIDAPEMTQEPFGTRARDALAALAPEGTPLGVELDVQETDPYGRVLAYLTLPDGRLLNEELLRGGFAVVVVFPPNVRHVERFREASREAREARAGLWAVDAFQCLPADHRAGRCPR